MSSCSNDDGGSSPVTETKYYPKKIDYFNRDAQGVETYSATTTFSYNENKQVSSINYMGYGDISFTYNSDGLPTRIVSSFSNNQMVSEFEYNGDRIVRLLQTGGSFGPYNVGYNASSRTYTYETLYQNYSFTLNSLNDLIKWTRSNNTNTNSENRELTYKTQGYGFLYNIDFPISFYLQFVSLGFDLERFISIKPLEKNVHVNNNGQYITEYTNTLDANNYVIESILTALGDTNGAGTIVRFEYQEL